MPITLIIKGKERFNEKTMEFIKPSFESRTITLEHSLVSVSKWESKWHKPFVSDTKKTLEETIDYIKCMTISQNVNDDVYDFLTEEHIRKINKYIEDPMTATWFNEQTQEEKSKRNHEQITSELIYYWMVALQIPYKFEKWHLNRLLTLIRVCNVKNKPAKKQSRRDIMSKNAALNAQRKKELGTNG